MAAATKHCLKCGAENQSAALACSDCGAVFAKLEALAAAGQLIRSIEPVAKAAAPISNSPSKTTAEALARARLTGKWSEVPPDLVRKEASAVVLTTTDFVEGRPIQEYRGIVATEHTFAFGAVYEEIAGLARNIVGSGRSAQASQHLQTARTEALQALRFVALDHAANAVVGLRIDYEEFSGANQRGLLAVIATGTAVRLKDAPES